MLPQAVRWLETSALGGQRGIEPHFVLNDRIGGSSVEDHRIDAHPAVWRLGAAGWRLFFSNGLESAIQHRLVHDMETLRQFVMTATRQSASADAIALLVAHRAAQRT